MGNALVVTRIVSHEREGSKAVVGLRLHTNASFFDIEDSRQRMSKTHVSGIDQCQNLRGCRI